MGMWVLKPCPICGHSARLIELKIGSTYLANRQDVSATIKCPCGLTFEKEWTEVVGENGALTIIGESIVPAWNRRISNA